MLKLHIWGVLIFGFAAVNSAAMSANVKLLCTFSTERSGNREHEVSWNDGDRTTLQINNKKVLSESSDFETYITIFSSATVQWCNIHKPDRESICTTINRLNGEYKIEERPTGERPVGKGMCRKIKDVKGLF